MAPWMGGVGLAIAGARRGGLFLGAVGAFVGALGGLMSGLAVQGVGKLLCQRAENLADRALVAGSLY